MADPADAKEFARPLCEAQGVPWSMYERQVQQESGWPRRTPTSRRLSGRWGVGDRLTPLRGVPGLLRLSDHEGEQLLRFANEMAGWYGVPIYLCGSALRKDDPRDIDIRASIPDEDFALRYGGMAGQWAQEGHTGAWTDVRWRWSADCTKRTKRAWRLTSLNVDFQVYPESYAIATYGDRPRIRLDERAEARLKDVARG